MEIWKWIVLYSTVQLNFNIAMEFTSMAEFTGCNFYQNLNIQHSWSNHLQVPLFHYSKTSYHSKMNLIFICLIESHYSIVIHFNWWIYWQTFLASIDWSKPKWIFLNSTVLLNSTSLGVHSNGYIYLNFMIPEDQATTLEKSL